LSLKEPDWYEVLDSISEQKCTPFLGAGACADWLPLGAKISNEMAKVYEYPLDDIGELDRVSQFVAIEHGDMVPKNFIIRQLKKISTPDFSREEYKNTPHAVLADLNVECL
jgi:hypothetical protein